MQIVVVFLVGLRSVSLPDAFAHPLVPQQWTGGVREKLEVELVMQTMLKELVCSRTSLAALCSCPLHIHTLISCSQGRSLVWEDDYQSESKSLSAASASDPHASPAAGVSMVSMDDIEDTDSLLDIDNSVREVRGRYHT